MGEANPSHKSPLFNYFKPLFYTIGTPIDNRQEKSPLFVINDRKKPDSCIFKNQRDFNLVFMNLKN